MKTYKPSERVQKQLDAAFASKVRTEDQDLRYTSILSMAEDYARQLTTQCPESRELSLALTKLEECTMWAIASIARNE